MPLGCGQLPRAGGGPPAASAPTRPPLEVAVPGYFYQPGPAYRQLAQNVPAVGVVVANVDNGAGAAVSPAWASATQSAHRAGITVLGYVDTGYLGTTGNTTRGPSSSQSRQAWMAQVEHDVDTWYRFYGPTVGGVFLDQVQESCGPAARDQSWVELYVRIYRYVKRLHPGAMVVANAGDLPDACYLRAADTVVTFEGDYQAYVDPAHGYREPGWERTVSPNRVWHLVYDATEAQMVDAVARARKRNAGFVYVTSLPRPNPWRGLPADGYWNRELSAVSGVADLRPPTTPRGLRATGVYFDRVSLSWRSSDDNVAVAGYDVYEDTSLVASVHHDSATLRGLAGATQHTYTVRARDAAGNVSSASNAVQVTTPAVDDSPPSAPGDARASAVFSRSVELTWAASTDPDSAVSSYEVDRGGAPPVVVPAGGETCPRTCAIVGGLAPRTRYVFTIRARDPSGNVSRAGKTVSVVTRPAAGPPIVNVTACVDSGGATFAATFTEAYQYHRVFVDSDGDPSTGYRLPVSSPFGADHMIESSLGDTLAYGYGGPVQGSWTTWRWEKDAQVTPVESAVNGTYTWKVPIAALGGRGVKQVVFEGGGSGGPGADVHSAPLAVTPHASCS